MKNIILLFIALLMTSCTDFLNVTPDHMDSLEDMFQTKQDAERSLYLCYSYLPLHGTIQNDPALLAGLEIVTTSNAGGAGAVPGKAWYIARGGNNVTDPYCNFWEGLQGGTDLYQGISTCNIFLANIHITPDMDSQEKLRWIAEVKFLKAYYHYWLTRMYGAIPIKDVDLSVDASTSDVKVYRNTLDECFDYIVKSLDDILDSNALPEMIDNRTTELGRITQAIVMAVKAEVLVTRASPLFNGTYRGVSDDRGIDLFPAHTDEEKQQFWVNAAKACEDAIDFLANSSNQLDELYVFDNSKLYKSVSERTKQLLTLMGAFHTPWNHEVIWANGATKNNVNGMQLGSIITALGNISNLSASANVYGGFYAVPIFITEQFYTKNGLPINEDRSWDYTNRMKPKLITPDQQYHLTMEQNQYTAACNMDREPRFYASLMFDREAWFGHVTTPSGQSFKSDDDTKPLVIKHRSGEYGGNQDGWKWNTTGYYPRKLFNVETVINTNGTLSNKNYAIPAMRLSGLYLYYAEALLESGASVDNILPWIDKVRARAGLRGVKETWTSPESLNPTKFQTKEGLKDIIHQERAVELTFEGHRYWDLRRWMKATTELRKPVTGWNVAENAADNYYKEVLVFQPEFLTRDYFWPIRLGEIYTDKNLKQNLGW